MPPTKTLYLDQCVLSDLRHGQAHRDDLKSAFSRLHGCAFVYSDVHVREILLSGRPLSFIEALEDIEAYFLQPTEIILEISRRSAELTPHVVREKIPQEMDTAVAAQLVLEQLHRLAATLHSAGRTMSFDDERETLIADINAYLDDTTQEMRDLAPPGFDAEPLLAEIQKQRHALITQMTLLDAHAIPREAHTAYEELSRLFDKEEMEEIPDNEIVEYIFSKIPEIKSIYPKGFGRNKLPCGTITGFSYMLFHLGVGKFERAKKNGNEGLVKRLYGQFRDCEHIEQAVRCHAFITKDKKAASLARAVYSYAGLPNQVLFLQTK